MIWRRRGRRRRSASSFPGLGIPKGPTRATLKRRRDAAEVAETKRVRPLVMAREEGECRVCRDLYGRRRAAQSMHEIVPRSIVDPATGQLGIRSLENSIAVCGSGTTGCHGALQAHRIRCEKLTPAGAQGPLMFREAA